ncbi:MAG: methyltransferase domain-containing protein [Pseudomonadota bacterium]
MSNDNRYDRRNIDTMEMVYGRGYLSGGGDDEVVRILDGIELADADVLDLGCGMGGATLAMLTRLNANHITGFDIDANLLRRAEELIDAASLGSRCTLVHGEPGPLPFDANSFDCVYVTAVSCHIENLEPFFTDIARVLKPGGVLAGCEWLTGERNETYVEWDDMLRARGLNFYFVAPDMFSAALHNCGFHDISLSDRTVAFTKFSQAALDRTDGELRESLAHSLGEAGFDAFRERTAVRLNALRGGGMLQNHFRAYK